MCIRDRLQKATGMDCGVHQTGELMLADDEDRMDWLRMAHARGRYLGMETELISTAEAKALVPFLEEEHFVGALWDPVGGHVDPSGITNAYAAAARAAGAAGGDLAKVAVAGPLALLLLLGQLRAQRGHRVACYHQQQKTSSIAEIDPEVGAAQVISSDQQERSKNANHSAVFTGHAARVRVVRAGRLRAAGRAAARVGER